MCDLVGEIQELIEFVKVGIVKGAKKGMEKQAEEYLRMCEEDMKAIGA